MRIALCNEVIRDLTIAQQAEFAAAVGYDGLELAPFTIETEHPHRLSSATITSVRRDVESAGIVVSGLHWLMVAPPGLSITSADPEAQASALDVMSGMIDLCAGLGATYLIHGSPGQRMLVAGDEDSGRQRAQAFFEAAAQRAAEAGVTYCLEPLSPDQTNYINTLAEAADVVAKIGEPAFTSMIDCSAAGTNETDDIPTLLRRHLKDGTIHHVHFNDPNRQGPGQGELDFAPIMQTLIEQVYDRWIGVEPFDYVPDGPAAAARAMGYIAGLKDAAR